MPAPSQHHSHAGGMPRTQHLGFQPYSQSPNPNDSSQATNPYQNQHQPTPPILNNHPHVPQRSYSQPHHPQQAQPQQHQQQSSQHQQQPHQSHQQQQQHQAQQQQQQQQVQQRQAQQQQQQQQQQQHGQQYTYPPHSYQPQNHYGAPSTYTNSYSGAPSSMPQMQQFIYPQNLQRDLSRGAETNHTQSPRLNLPSANPGNYRPGRQSVSSNASNQNSSQPGSSMGYTGSPRPNNLANHTPPQPQQMNVNVGAQPHLSATNQHIHQNQQPHNLTASSQQLNMGQTTMNPPTQHANSSQQHTNAGPHHMSTPPQQRMNSQPQQLRAAVPDESLSFEQIGRLQDATTTIVKTEPRSESVHPNVSNEAYSLPPTSSAPSAPNVPDPDLLQPEPTPQATVNSRKRSADVPIDTPASTTETSSPAPKRAKQEDKVIYTVVVADVEPHDAGDENKVQTVYCAGTYATKQAANGAAWSHLLQGFAKADFNCDHTMVDGCSRIEVKGLRPLQEEPRSQEMIAARQKSLLIATVTPLTVPDVPLNNNAAKMDIVYIVTLMTDDGHFEQHKKESNTEIIGVYHNFSMAKWHANATLTKFYGPAGRNAMGIDRKIVEKKDTVLRLAIREGPETKIIEVIKKKVGGPMSNTWSSNGPPPNIHGNAGARAAAGAGSRS